ncbi:MAG: hypothetical protein WCK34_03770 [Bacteroidota bacterium]
MKKFHLFVLISLLSAACAMSQTAMHVQSGYATIQSAVDADDAGDVIGVVAGTYAEQVHLTANNIPLHGSGTSNTFIESPAILASYFTTAGHDYKPVVYAEGVANFTLNNLTVDGDGRGGANDRFVGVGFRNAGGVVQDADVLGITETPMNGNQNCDRVYANNNTGGHFSLGCSNVTISSYQENGMIFPTKSNS